MGHVLLLTHANVLMAGRALTVAFLFVIINVFTMATVLTQILAHVNEVGLVMIVQLPSVHKNATMDSAWHQIHANVISGRMSGEMAVLEVEFLCFRNQMVILN